MPNCLHMEGKNLLNVGQECREQSNCSLAVMSWQMLQQLCSAGQGGLGRRLQLAKLDMGPSHWAWVVFPASCPTLVTATNNLKSALQKSATAGDEKKSFHSAHNLTVFATIRQA